ncbi:uncharacterized protein LOC143437361 isoform X3 [Arvicanthis niloticus]|uniref:uncharacterized protein LOC143310333 isoform X3 n=1 Tax=Arvicanthis niloticus TaxID=61156 RepID=UPI00402B7FA5
MPRAARRPRRGLLTSQERDPAPHPVSGRTGIAAAADPGPVALLLTSEARDGDPRRTRAAAIGPVMPRGSRRPRGYQSILIDYQSSRGSLLHPIDELEDAASSSRLFSEYLFPSRHNMDTNPQGTREATGRNRVSDRRMKTTWKNTAIKEKIISSFQDASGNVRSSTETT